MSSHIVAPDAFRWTNPTETSAVLSWRAAHDAVRYEIRGGGTSLVRSVKGTSTHIKGLPPSSDHTLQIRSISATGDASAWANVQVFTTIGVPVQPQPNTYFKVLDADRQTFRTRLPNAEGTQIECLIALWWQPSDGGWWVSFESPIGTPIVLSRRLCLNGGVLDGLPGVLSGNIYIRHVNIGGSEEPDRQSFVRGTHRLTWEAQ